MSIDFFLDDIDTDNLDGYDSVAEGRYHFSVAGVEFNERGTLVLDCEVLAGTVPGQEGKVHREYFNAPNENSKPGVKKRFLQLALATGIVTKDQLDQIKQSGQPFSPDWNLMVGRQFCGEVTIEEYVANDGTTKSSAKLGFNIWSLQSPKAQGIPLASTFTEGEEGGADDPFAGVPL